MSDPKPSNKDIAHILDRIADLLETQNANPFRIRSYRQGAESIRNWRKPVAKIVEQGDHESLKDIPNIGDSLAGVIEEVVQRGRSSLLSRLQGEVSPVDVFTQVPGIGKELAQRIADQLGIDTLEELELAAHDGRLEQVEGFGPQRAESVRVSLAGMLSGAAQRRIRRRDQSQEEEGRPSVKTLLEVDAEYRKKARAGELKKIAPKRFNPDHEAWLPILHTERGDWNFTALFSNTARAHELDKTHDWVVIYYDKPGTKEDQVTVVTGSQGDLKGKRVVRGRESETRRHYHS
jgi:DNA polymerase (family 10)